MPSSIRTVRPSVPTASRLEHSFLAGVNLHTWTGFGSVTYWNAYVAATEMHGAGTYFDAARFPVAARSGSWNTRGTPDPLYTEPGNNLQSPTEIGIDSFQADRSH